MWRNVGEEREKRRGDKVSQICQYIWTCSARVWKLVTSGCLEPKWTQTERFSFCVSSFSAPRLQCSDWAWAELVSALLHPTLSLFMSRCMFLSVQWYVRRVWFSRKKIVLTWNCSQQGLGIILRNRVMISRKRNCCWVKKVQQTKCHLLWLYSRGSRYLQNSATHTI